MGTDRENKQRTVYTDALMNDFLDPVFQKAFKLYFTEMNVQVEDWDSLFQKMNDDDNVLAYLRLDEHHKIVGFIQFQKILFSSWFFEETYGFIREFWISEKYRSQGHGSELLKKAEEYFLEQGIYSTILTTDSAEDFYGKQGYVKAPGCKAKNNDDVYVKRLK